MTRTLELDLTRGAVTRLAFGLPVHLTLRAAGDMGPSGAPEHPRRDAVLSGLGIDPARYVTVRQIHSREVVAVSSARRPAPGTQADGLVTDDPSLALGVTVADCMPILLHAPGHGVFGALHSGWRGTGIVSTAVGLLAERYGVDPADLSVLLGPAIGSCCYRVDDERAALFADLWGGEAVIRREDGPYLDLRTANRRLLEAHGVGEVLVADACTSCTAAFGSYRREGAARFTRMMAVIQGE
jgi:hypothetical protein